MLWEGLLILLEGLWYALELVFLIVWKPLLIIAIICLIIFIYGQICRKIKSKNTKK